MVENILFKKGLREIKENLKQYITVIIIAILAVSLFTGIYANYKGFSNKLTDIYTKSNMCDGIILTKGNNDSFKDELNNANIYYEERIYLTADVNSTNVNVITFNDSSVLNKPAYMSVDKLDANLVLVDEGFLKNLELEIGDTFILKLPNLNLPLNLSLEFKIDGTLTHPEALENSEYSPSLIYLGEEALKTSILNYAKDNNLDSFITADLIDSYLPQMYNEYLLKGDNTSSVINLFKNKEDVLFSLLREDLPTNITIEADVIQAKQLLYIFPIIFYLVALLIILTSISELIDKEQKNIGLLKALGYSNLEILLHYTNIFIILCLIGGICGIIIGPLIIPNVMNQKYNILYQLPNIKTSFFHPFYLVSVLLLIVIVYLVAIFSLASILRKVPASSIRGDNSYQMKATIFDKIMPKKDNFLSLRMAFRNMKRKVSRTFMVLFGVMGCSALLLCGFGIEDTLDNSINKEVSLIPFDIHLYYEDNSSHLEELSKNDELLYIDEYAKLDISISAKNTIDSYIYVLPEKSHIFVPKYKENSCLITSKVANEIGANIGDEISFIYGNNSYKTKITDIIDISFSQGIYISSASNILNTQPTNCWLKIKDISKVDSILEELLEIDDIYDGITLANLRLQAEDKLAAVRIMTNTIKVFAILLAIVVLYNLALLNFKERIKDIATLKVLGFTTKEIASSFLIEVLLLTLVGSAIGLALGYPLMYGVLAINENPLLSYLYHIDVSSYLITLLITAGFSVVINLIMSTFTRKVKMVESLKAVD